MTKRDHVLAILGEISRPIVHERQDVVGSVHRVDTSFDEVVAVALLSPLEVSLLSRCYVVHVDRNEAVPVRPSMLVDEAEGVKELVDWGHELVLEAGTENRNG